MAPQGALFQQSRVASHRPAASPLTNWLLRACNIAVDAAAPPVAPDAAPVTFASGSTAGAEGIGRRQNECHGQLCSARRALLAKGAQGRAALRRGWLSSLPLPRSSGRAR